jgi:hypothetical protein
VVFLGACEQQNIRGSSLIAEHATPFGRRQKVKWVVARHKYDQDAMIALNEMDEVLPDCD